MITTLAGVIEIGLTGGIGSGKSTVADLLVERGAVLIDADRIVRELQAPGGSVFAGMVERWGEAIVSADGSLDRQAVAEIVFNDEDELKALNDLVHPAVGEEMKAQREAVLGTEAIVVLAGGETRRASVIDSSAGGVGLAFHEGEEARLESGEEVELRMSSPDAFGTVSTKAAVRHVDELGHAFFSAPSPPAGRYSSTTTRASCWCPWP